ncbi:lambda Rz1-like protein [Pseudomonas phage OBP]|uniref:lambda Rz1-like protein n=1 Tax=Pseudomonas phage OBP TaxID=1124849 RepID=UPI000240D561|nr:lambda Rz1-like protein [Pseudomonas phage OBP]AEV89577.1 lambda Rz1-like protein [Pseudomonas phage OBP]
MDDKWKVRIAGLQTIAMWLLLLLLAGWLFFKPDNTLNKDTVEKLSVAVDRISAASENIGKVAADQREWAANLQNATQQNQQKREADYEDLYGKYGYDKNSNLTIADIYARRVQQPTEDNGGRDVRRDENRASKTGPVPNPASQPKK